jgi:hypothetical protein
MAHADLPHFAFPFRRDAKGRVAVVEQETVEHYSAQANVVIRCPTGFRNERPEFGWPHPEFQTVPLDLGPLEFALRKFVPRSTVRAEEYADAADAAVRNVSLKVEV